MPLIYLIAGEPSGDLLAARLMAALREAGGEDIRFAGIGGEAMREQGLDSLFPQADLAVMGLAEVVPSIPRILGRLKQTLADIRRCRPDVVLTVDSWGFTGRVAKQLKAEGHPALRIHYVAPMVWAWKAKRVHQLAARLDLLLCLLPNEPEWFHKAGLAAEHVGHAVLESGAGDGDGAAFRARHGIAAGAPLLCLLPGSRRSETSRLLPVFGEVAGLLAARHPDLRLVLPTVETVAAEVAAAAAGWAVPALVVHGRQERYDAFAASRAALAASGTVALELALAGLPMIITYRVTPVTAWLLRRLVKVKWACLLNLLLDRQVVPEFLQERCRAATLAAAVAEVMDDETVRRTQRDGLGEALACLGQGAQSPSRRAAGLILKAVAERKEP
ncbi:MAG TPA: lipid-A-disaccharide synthase [Rhodospirillaceae bacterium]|nr:lipid-A-disaccharide synthase [Rhodospirillaceae bacterium]